MNKVLTFGIAGLAIVGVVAAGSLGASAMNGRGYSDQSSPRQGMGGGYESSLEMRASVFGISVDELKEALKTQTMSQIAVEKGMDQAAFQAKMTEAAKARWEARGLSAEEIQTRLEERQARHDANVANHEFGSGAGKHMGGYGRNR